MSKLCCFAVVLAVVYLPVILLALEADAVESMFDGCSTVEVKVSPSQGRIGECGEVNSTLGRVANTVQMIALNQQANARELRKVKRLLGSGCAGVNATGVEDREDGDEDTETRAEEDTAEITGVIRDEIDRVVTEVRAVKKLVASIPTASNCSCIPPSTGCVDVDPSKQALVSALACTYLVCFHISLYLLTYLLTYLLLVMPIDRPIGLDDVLVVTCRQVSQIPLKRFYRATQLYASDVLGVVRLPLCPSVCHTRAL